MRDYRVKITIRNDRLLSAIEEMGHPSVMSFCRKYNLPYTSTNEIVNGRKPPLKEDGDLRKECKDLLDLLGMDIEEAFTKRQMQGFRRTTFETKVEEEQLLKLVNPAKNQEISAIEADVSSRIKQVISNSLSPRQEKVIRLRYGLNEDKKCHTYEELGLHFNVTRERARQMELRALERLKNIKNTRDLINTGFYDVFTSVNVKPEQIEEAEVFSDLLLNKKNKKINYRNRRSKKMEKNYNKLCSKIDKISDLTDDKKQQVKTWVEKTLDKCRLEVNYSLYFGWSYEHNWMYNQVKDIMKELKSKNLLHVYKRAKKIMNKIEKRSSICLEPVNNKIWKRSKFLIYYKQDTN